MESRINNEFMAKEVKNIPMNTKPKPCQRENSDLNYLNQTIRRTEFPSTDEMLDICKKPLIVDGKEVWPNKSYVMIDNTEVNF